MPDPLRPAIYIIWQAGHFGFGYRQVDPADDHDGWARDLLAHRIERAFTACLDCKATPNEVERHLMGIVAWAREAPCSGALLRLAQSVEEFKMLRPEPNRFELLVRCRIEPKEPA